MLQQNEVPEWIINSPMRGEIPTETEDEWAEYIYNMTIEGLMEDEAPRPEVCPICRSYMNTDAICDFCGFGEDEELYNALKNAANLAEAYAEF